MDFRHINRSQGAVGSVTGSEDWKSSAENDKQAGVDAMKAASANRDPQQSGFGKVSRDGNDRFSALTDKLKG